MFETNGPSFIESVVTAVRASLVVAPPAGAGTAAHTEPQWLRRADLSTRFAVNGRFLGQPITGVQRYGREILAALDDVLSARGRLASLLIPGDVRSPPALRAFAIEMVHGFRHHAWEQIELPLHGAKPILNLCNTGPVALRRQVVCLHDLNVFNEPGSYRRGFRLAYQMLQPLLARRSAGVATVSRTSARQIADRFDVPVGRIAVLPNGHEHSLRWDASRSRLNGEPERRPFVLLLGSRARHKNTGLMVGLADRLDALGLDLVIAGGGATIFSETGPAAESHPNLHWLGAVSDDDLAFLFGRAFCLAFPSFTEGFGLPIVEAMALGCPVVSSDRASMPEVCGRAALMAAPDDAEAWLAQIGRLKSSTALQDELRSAGFEQARRFSWSASAEGYLDLMDGLS